MIVVVPCGVFYQRWERVYDPRKAVSLADGALQIHAVAIVAGADGGWYVVDRTFARSEPMRTGYIEAALDGTCGGRSLRF